MEHRSHQRTAGDVRYLGINDGLADSRGVLREEMSEDGLHLSLSGYRLSADALRPLLAERLGTPDERDLAPPPTGEPAAR